MRYLDKRLSNEDELEGKGLADLVDPLKRTSLKDSEKEVEGPTPKRATKKKKAKKAILQEPSGEGEKKAAKHQKRQGDEPEPMISKPPPQKKQKGQGKKKKKRQVEVDADELTLRKKKAKRTLSATLGRAPEAEPSPTMGILPGAVPTAVESRTSLDKQLEAHLFGTEPPATVIQQSQTTASMTAPQGLDMGGFLAGLRKSIPQAGT